MMITSPSMVSWTTFSELMRRRGSLTDARLFVPVGDSSPVEVIRGELDLDPIPWKDADVVPTHLSGDVAEHVVSVVEFDPEHRVREGLGDLALHLYLLLFGHASGQATGPGRKSACYRPSKLALPGPSSRNERTAPFRSSLAKRPPETAGVSASALSTPPSR